MDQDHNKCKSHQLLGVIRNVHLLLADNVDESSDNLSIKLIPDKSETEDIYAKVKIITYRQF